MFKLRPRVVEMHEVVQLTDKEKEARRVLSRFGVGLGALGGLLIIFGVHFLYTSNETLSWSTVDGKVLNAEVNTHWSNWTKPAGTVPRGTKEYYVAVHYRYEVDGNTYVSSRYSLGDGARASAFFKEQSRAQEEADRLFAPNAAVTVYYNPKAPDAAVLKTGWNWGTFVPLLLGLFLSGAGWLFYRVQTNPMPRRTT